MKLDTRNFAPIAALVFLCFLLFCTNCQPSVDQSESSASAAYELSLPSLQNLLDSMKLQGAVLLYDAQSSIYYSNDYKWVEKGFLPASTFKIPNSIIALELGIIANDSTLIKWNGEDRWLDVWEQDLYFKDAFQLSCVPCYQEIARSVGKKRMTDYLEKLNFGQMVVDSIDFFWLGGASRISQWQQIDFLKRLYQEELPIQDRTFAIMKSLLQIETNEDYTLSGKTGWSTPNGDNGWFVGYVEFEDKLFFVATNIEPLPGFDRSEFGEARWWISQAALNIVLQQQTNR